MRSSLPFLLALAGCPSDENAPPPKLEGHWELLQVEVSDGEVEGQDVVLSKFPGCTWGRRTFVFDGKSMRVENAVLCPGQGKDEHYGCQVSAAVPATWDEANGAWLVATPVRAHARTKGLVEGALDIPSRCGVEIAAGQYLVRKIRGQKWKWEMGIPDGTVFRLRPPETDDPDFVMAMRSGDAPADGGAE